MATSEIEKKDWQNYFNQVSQRLMVMTVEVIVTGPDMGAQREATELPLVGLSYDPRDDVFSIVAENLEHRVSNPVAIFVEDDGRGLKSIQITDGDGHQHLATFTRALPLPPPEEEARL